MSTRSRSSVVTLDYVDAGELHRRIERSPDSLLGVVGFSTVPEVRGELPAVEVPLQPLAGGPFEVWSTGAPVVRGCEGSISYADAGSVIFGVLRALPSEMLAADSLGAYNELLAFFARHGVRPVRMWNYFPRINEVAGIERYRSFCVGRSQAFEHARYDMFSELPAGSAIGTPHGALFVYFIAAREKAKFIENQRQVSAFRYPDRYGPRSPSFARGAVIDDRGARTLFISGTASIIGHESIHGDDLVAQTEETIRNMSIVLRNGLRVNSFDASLRTLLKIYVRRPDDLRVIREILEEKICSSGSVYVQGDVCRSELLVEIEAVVTD